MALSEPEPLPASLELPRAPLVFAAIAGLLWLAATAATLILVARFRTLATLDLLDWSAIAAGATAPLGLIGVIAMLWIRLAHARAEAGIIQALNASRALETRLTAVAYVHETISGLERRLEDRCNDLAERARQLDDVSATLDRSVADAGDTLGSSIRRIDEHTQALGRAAADVRVDLGAIMADLPTAEQHALRLGRAFGEAREAIAAQSAEADERATALTERAAQLRVDMEASVDAIRSMLGELYTGADGVLQRVTDGRESLGGATDTMLAGLAEALEAMRSALDSQSQSMFAAVEQARAQFESSAIQSTRSMTGQIHGLLGQVQQLGNQLDTQGEQAGRIGESIEQSLGSVEQRLAALDEVGEVHAARWQERARQVSAGVDEIIPAVKAHYDTIEGMLQRVGALRLLLGESTDLLDRKIPAAADTVHAAFLAARTEFETTRDAVGDLQAVIDRMAIASAEVPERLQLAAITEGERLEAATRALAELDGHAATLRATLDDLSSGAESIGADASAKLVEAMGRVRDSADEAAANARAALATVADEAARSLGESIEERMRALFDEPVSSRLENLSQHAERAMASAHDASEQLSRQLLKIARTSAQIQDGIRDNEARNEVASQEEFSKRSALLIDSLNSIAIDISKLLSTDVADTAWAAYLKGDRSVFARRAVKLLEAGDARQIGRSYENDPDFREQVSRYIHDFESMIRRIMAQRDGGPLAVALMSSDIGKLYAALGQSVDRFRN